MELYTKVRSRREFQLGKENCRMRADISYMRVIGVKMFPTDRENSNGLICATMRESFKKE